MMASLSASYARADAAVASYSCKEEREFASESGKDDSTGTKEGGGGGARGR